MSRVYLGNGQEVCVTCEQSIKGVVFEIELWPGKVRCFTCELEFNLLFKTVRERDVME